MRKVWRTLLKLRPQRRSCCCNPPARLGQVCGIWEWHRPKVKFLVMWGCCNQGANSRASSSVVWPKTESAKSEETKEDLTRGSGNTNPTLERLQQWVFQIQLGPRNYKSPMTNTASSCVLIKYEQTLTLETMVLPEISRPWHDESGADIHLESTSRSCFSRLDQATSRRFVAIATPSNTRLLKASCGIQHELTLRSSRPPLAMIARRKRLQSRFSREKYSDFCTLSLLFCYLEISARYRASRAIYCVPRNDTTAPNFLVSSWRFATTISTNFCSSQRRNDF